MQKLTSYKDSEGWITYDNQLSKEDWKAVLRTLQREHPEWLPFLQYFYQAPDHSATCSEIDKQMHNRPIVASHPIAAVGRAAEQMKGNFMVEGEGDEGHKYWVIPMLGRDTEKGFLYCMRPELTEAMEEFQLTEIAHFTWIPFYTELANKLLTYKDRRAELVDFIYAEDGLAYYTNYLHLEDKTQKITDIDPFSFFGIFNTSNKRNAKITNRQEILRRIQSKFGIQAEVPRDFDGIPVLNYQRSFFYHWNRLEESCDFIWDVYEKLMRGELTDDWFNEMHFVSRQTELTMPLFWVRPNDYLTLDSNNRTYLEGLGLFSNLKDSITNTEQYLQFLQQVRDKMASGTIPENSFPEISFAAWQGKGETEDTEVANVRKIWMAGYSFGSGEVSQLDRFLSNGTWEGHFDEKNKSDARQMEEALSIRRGDIVVLKASYTRGTNHDISILGIKAVGVASKDAAKVEATEQGYTQIAVPVEYKSTEEKEFSPSNYWRTIQPLKNNPEIETYIRSCVMEKNPYQSYIDLLKENHNLVLTGAPGTGKTYMARKIAEAMGAEVAFVQFHPSYDYTDFVEGLRPTRDNGFERKDGIFKEFCKRALLNQQEAKKSVETLAEELSIQEKLDDFLSESVENGKEYTLKSGGSFAIMDYDDQRIRIRTSNEITTFIAISYPEVYDLLINNIPLEKVHDIRNHYQRKFGTQQDSYEFTICQEVRKRKGQQTVAASWVPEKPFVFIIDEINRGELSKIFGELFFAIDPGYRGEKGQVQTQYQNLIDSADVFARGFYVPSNVYILGTMNDIDRSVESMDFAMRRRFTWEEIRPKDRIIMWENATWAKEAEERMQRLNEVICQMEGLGAAFQIGPAYFLRLNENNGNFAALWQRNLLPLLREYLRGFRRIDEHLKRLQSAYEGEEVIDVE